MLIGRDGPIRRTGHGPPPEYGTCAVHGNALRVHAGGLAETFGTSNGSTAPPRTPPGYRGVTEGGPMPDKSPQKPSAKKPGKSLKQKRESKKVKKAGGKIIGG